MDTDERRARIAARSQAGGDPLVLFPVESIEVLVHDFYAAVREDAVLGPIFDRRVRDWPAHLARMVAFWRTVLRSEPAFKPAPSGPPAALHQRIGELRHSHFDRWMALFSRSVAATFRDDAARYVIACAERIRGPLSRHLSASNDGGAGEGRAYGRATASACEAPR